MLVAAGDIIKHTWRTFWGSFAFKLDEACCLKGVNCRQDGRVHLLSSDHRKDAFDDADVADVEDRTLECSVYSKSEPCDSSGAEMECSYRKKRSESRITQDSSSVEENCQEGNTKVSGEFILVNDHDDRKVANKLHQLRSRKVDILIRTLEGSRIVERQKKTSALSALG